jgi:uncharacterized tellurite resistance protein B-like protein
LSSSASQVGAEKEIDMSAESSYSKSDLEKILSFSFVLSTIDGHIHEHEIDHAIDFVKNNWHGEHSDLKEFLVSTKEKAFGLFKSDSLSDALEDITRSLAGTLDNHQKENVISLVSEMVQADGHPGSRELDMVKIIYSHLYDSETISKDGLKNIVATLMFLS